MSDGSWFMNPSLEQRAEVLKSYGMRERFVKEKERLQITSVSRTKWWELEQISMVPPKKHFGVAIAWLMSDLLLWLNHYPSS